MNFVRNERNAVPQPLHEFLADVKSPIKRIGDGFADIKSPISRIGDGFADIKSPIKRIGDGSE